jgi:DNA repair exonuclease SbcCD ATPase subunit
MLKSIIKVCSFAILWFVMTTGILMIGPFLDQKHIMKNEAILKKQDARILKLRKNQDEELYQEQEKYRAKFDAQKKSIEKQQATIDESFAKGKTDRDARDKEQATLDETLKAKKEEMASLERRFNSASVSVDEAIASADNNIAKRIEALESSYQAKKAELDSQPIETVVTSTTEPPVESQQ